MQPDEGDDAGFVRRRVCAVFVHLSAQPWDRRETGVLFACAHKIRMLPFRGPIAPHNGPSRSLVRTACAVRAALGEAPLPVGVWAGREARSLAPGLLLGVSAACPHCWRNFPALAEHAALPRHLDDLGLRCHGSGHAPHIRLDEKPDPRSTVFGAWVHLKDGHVFR